jgi:hypothetical protein
VCTDLEYFNKSVAFYKRLMIRRATMGTGKLSASGLTKWFKLDMEDQFSSLKKYTEDNITEELKRELQKILVEAQCESWAPKAPLQGYHSHMDDFFMFF